MVLMDLGPMSGPPLGAPYMEHTKCKAVVWWCVSSLCLLENIRAVAAPCSGASCQGSQGTNQGLGEITEAEMHSCVGCRLQYRRDEFI